MRPGRLNKWVTLSRSPQTSGDSDGFWEALDPPGVWAQIEPLNPAISDDTRTQASRVTIRYHAQVTLDTKVSFGTRDLMVRGVQNTNEANAEMILFCEEAIP